jgi:hypothetical protein
MVGHIIVGVVGDDNIGLNLTNYIHYLVTRLTIIGVDVKKAKSNYGKVEEPKCIPLDNETLISEQVTLKGGNTYKEDNAKSDGCTNITVGVSDLLKGVDLSGGKYDFCVANIVADIIIRMLPDVRAYLKEGAPLILSGIIGERAAEVREAVLKQGFTVEKEISENDWIGMLVRI